MYTIAVVNQKGGAGKTTTSMQLAAALSNRGYRVLGVDLDAQANFTSTATASAGGIDEGRPTVYDLLLGTARAADARTPTSWGSMLPASLADKRLATVNSALADDPGKTFRLREALAGLAAEGRGPDVDYVVVDTPPSRDVLSYNALVAADGVVIPSEAEEYSIAGIKDIVDSVASTRRYANPGLQVLGIVLTQVRPNVVLHRDMRKAARDMADAIGTVLFEPSIRQACAVGESQAVGQSVFDYAPGSGVASDYELLADSVVRRVREVSARVA